VKRGKNSFTLDYITGWGFLIPSLLFLSLTSLIPLIYTFWISFTNYSIYRPGQTEYIGFQNYISGIQDWEFITAAKNSLIIISISLFAEFLIGLTLALILFKDKPTYRTWRTFLLIPCIIAPVVVGVLWRLLLNPDYGLFTLGLKNIGLDRQWLSDPFWAKISVIFVEVWTWTPFIMLIFVAGLKSLSDTPLEAAKIDGANGFQIFWYITLPMLKPVIVIVLLLRLMDAFKMFDNVYVLTYGGPGSATSVLSLQIYKKGLKYFDLAVASAQSWIFHICIFLISFFILRTFTKVGRES